MFAFSRSLYYNQSIQFGLKLWQIIFFCILKPRGGSLQPLLSQYSWIGFLIFTIEKSGQEVKWFVLGFSRFFDDSNVENFNAHWGKRMRIYAEEKWTFFKFVYSVKGLRSPRRGSNVHNHVTNDGMFWQLSYHDSVVQRFSNKFLNIFIHFEKKDIDLCSREVNVFRVHFLLKMISESRKRIEPATIESGWRCSKGERMCWVRGGQRLSVSLVFNRSRVRSASPSQQAFLLGNELAMHTSTSHMKEVILIVVKERACVWRLSKTGLF